MIASWLLLGALSGCVFGIADICTKNSLRNGDALAVLCATFAWAVAFWIPLTLVATLVGRLPDYLQLLFAVNLSQHGLIAGKSACLALSSFAAFAAIKRLPITIAGALRASGPIWVLIGALIVFGEVPRGLQGVGFLIAMVAFGLYSLAGARESTGIISIGPLALMLLAVLLASASLVFDKILVITERVDPRIIQLISDAYRFVMVLSLLIMLRSRAISNGKFRFDKGIIISGLGMSLGEFIYFQAVQDSSALLSVLSVLRRVSLLIAFPASVIWFGERDARLKGLALSVLAAALLLIVVGPSL